MLKRLAGLVLVGAIGFAFLSTVESSAQDSGKREASAASKKAYATRDRVKWTTSRVVGSPDPPAPYQLQVAYKGLQFEGPLAFAKMPGTKRFAIAERYGKVFTAPWKNRATKDKSLLLELDRTIYGVAFHPEFAKNGRFFVMSLTDAANPSEKGSRVSEFTAKNPKKKPVADPDTERVLIEWPSGGHNGGCLRFGPDGYLYLATGDGSGIADLRKTGQDLSDLLGAVLRIDVDQKSADLPYGIPDDNPFVDTRRARPEIYSYGHRQLWKFSFDTKSGTLWGGEVGQDLWEMVYIIQKGGNYGWSIREGKHPFRPERPKGPTEFVDPIVEHPHHEFRSITGGFVYHGSRLPRLKGAYIYGDYDTGRIWALRYDAKTQKVTEQYELCDEQIRLVEFGQTPDGEVQLVDFAGGQLHELAPAPPPAKNIADFPRKLSETGLFASVKDLTPAAGVIPYDVNSPLWSDHAKKDRFLAVPGSGQIEFEAVTYPQPAPGSIPGWRFPDGTVLVKTFSLEMEAGNPQSTRRLETRLLHHKRMSGVDNEYGAQVWLGYTYVWNEDQTDAELLDTKGADRTYTIKDASAPGGVRKQTWHFPSRTECTLCHTMAAKYVLGVNTGQMNREFDYGGKVGARNQIDYLNELGLFHEPAADVGEKLDRLPNYHDKLASVADRARSYLQSNCSHCHRKWGGGNAEFQLLSSLPIDETGTIQTRPGQGIFELKNDPRILVPGEPDRSLIYLRMDRIGLGRMPHVASSVKDEASLTLIKEWIQQLKEPSN